MKETIRKRVIDPETRERWITWAYMLVTCGMLLHHVWVTIHFADPENGAFLWAWWLALGIVTAILGRMWKDPCFWILTGLLLLKLLRVAIPMPAVLRTSTQAVFAVCLYAFVICYGAGRALAKKDRETFTALFCGLWTLAAAVMACFSLYTVWNGTEIANLGTKSFYINPSENRLWPIYHPVEGGTLASVSVAAAMAGFCLTKRKTIRALYLPAILLIFLMGVFCSSRTSYILTAMAVCAPVCMLLYEPLCRWKRQGKAVPALRIAAVCALYAGLVLLVIVVQLKVIPVYHALRGQGAGLVSAAAAEEAAAAPAAEVSTRDFVLDKGADSFLAGRIQVWGTVLEALKENPTRLLWGQSVYKVMGPVNAIRTAKGLEEMYHTHSTFLQTLWENGIPALLLFLAFFCIFAKNAFRLITDRTAPMWQRLIPLPAALCWLADMADCTGYCNWGKPPMTILYVFAGLTIAIAREKRSNQKMKQTGAEKA